MLHAISAQPLNSAFDASALSGLCPGSSPALLRTLAAPRWRDTLQKSLPIIGIIGATYATAYILAEYTREPRVRSPQPEATTAPVHPRRRSIVTILNPLAQAPNPIDTVIRRESDPKIILNLIPPQEARSWYNFPEPKEEDIFAEPTSPLRRRKQSPKKNLYTQNPIARYLSDQQR